MAVNQEEHSCLVINQSGLDNPAGLEWEEAEEALHFEARMLGLEVVEPQLATVLGKDDAGEHVEEPGLPFISTDEENISDLEPLYSTAELQAADRLGVTPPRWYRVYQARAATRARRGPSDIKYIVWHTPEGYEAGTISVLTGGRAGFDVFLPNNARGRKYKTNNWWNYIAWQAGNWFYNKHSIGAEMGNFARLSGQWPLFFYDQLAYVNAFLGEVCRVPVRNGRRGVPGYIDHAEITPASRVDPGRYFKRHYMLNKIADIRAGRTSAEPPEPPEPRAPELVYIVNHKDSDAKRYSFAASRALEHVNIPVERLDAFHEAKDVRWASFRARHGRLGQYVCIVGGERALSDLHPQAKAALRDEAGNWYPKTVSDLWDCTTEIHTRFRWAISALCARADKDKHEALDKYESVVQSGQVWP